MKKKMCSGCSTIKELSEFYSWKTRKGLSYRRQCKECWSKKGKEYRDIKHPNYEKDRYQKNMKFNRDKSLKTYYNLKDDPEFKLRRREYQLKRIYGITLEEFEELAKSQNYKCAICGISVEDAVGNGLLHVDHNHRTGKIRALLCHKCNTALGGFDDSIEILEKAIMYLKIHKEE